MARRPHRVDVPQVNPSMIFSKSKFQKDLFRTRHPYWHTKLHLFFRFCFFSMGDIFHYPNPVVWPQSASMHVILKRKCWLKQQWIIIRKLTKLLSNRETNYLSNECTEIVINYCCLHRNLFLHLNHDCEKCNEQRKHQLSPTCNDYSR